NIRQRLGIAELNDMQRRMAALDTTGAVTLAAPTGSGKTIAFAIPFLRSLGNPDGRIRGVVIAPSRELVLQIVEVMRPVATDFRVLALYGGHSVEDEVKSLSVTPDIIIATPGRLLDHVKRGNVALGDVVTVVLDEYDKSLELGFADEMKRLVKKMTRARLYILTSATPMAELPDYFPRMKRTDIEVESKEKSGNVMKFRVVSPSRDKLDTLVELLRGMDDTTAIVFVNHRESAERVYERLRREKLPVGLYHGGLQQNERENALEMLANGTTPILVSTDLAARGIDIPVLGAVVHYHLPVNEATWTHRNGRTGRQDADGLVYILATDDDTMPDFVEWDKEIY
ncbi:MAG: DEAD/DEAH box helicase, partial [Duncaniella sp.]|nr:DEAD/DEAH box helicase [Duncaniella sp.]